MKGFVYLDHDGKLTHKTYDYIKNENPGFQADNAAYIAGWWEFDTDNRSSIVTLLKQFQAFSIDTHLIAEFREAIGIPVSSKSTNANSI